MGSKAKVQTVYRWGTVCAILLKFGFDYITYQITHSYIKDAYKVTLSLQKLEQATENLIVAPDREKALSDIRVALTNVSGLIDDPVQQQLLSKISLLMQSLPATATATATVSEMLAIESQLLLERLHTILIRNQNLEKSFKWTLAIDGALLVLLLALFFAELKIRNKITDDLSFSLYSLKAVNIALQEQQLKRQMEIKTTVHDLKNPLGSIYGFAELIDIESSSLESVQKFSSAIRRISKSSLELVDSLLSTHDGAPYKLEPVDLASILEEICIRTEPQAKLKSQCFIREFEMSKAMVLGNRMKLEELFSNILGNAVKYSPQLGNIWIRCQSIGANFRIEIEDQGPGFNGTDKIKAFQYAQVLSAKPTGNESSTGYGLFIAKQIAEFHKGRIQISDSKSGTGACVSFEIPRLQPIASKSQAALAEL